MSEINFAFSQKKYKTLVIDPPWQFKRSPRCVRPAYSLLSLDAIKSLPIRVLAEENAHCYLWTPSTLLDDGFDVLRAWGFNYKTLVTWAKHQVGPGNYFRNSTEHVLFGTRGRLPVLRHDQRTWFLADRRQHSRKPDEFYRIAESMSPGPRIDIFSRQSRQNWDQFGDQCNFFDLQNKKGDSNDKRNSAVEGNGSGGHVGGKPVDDLQLDEREENSLSEGGRIVTF